MRQIYDYNDPELAVEWVAEIGRDFVDPEMPPEVRPLGAHDHPMGRGRGLLYAGKPDWTLLYPIQP